MNYANNYSKVIKFFYTITICFMLCVFGFIFLAFITNPTVYNFVSIISVTIIFAIVGFFVWLNHCKNQIIAQIAIDLRDIKQQIKKE